MNDIAIAFQQEEDPDSRLHRQIALFNLIDTYNKDGNRQRDRILTEIWREHGDYFLHCMFKHAMTMGGVDGVFLKDAVYEYRTPGKQAADVAGFEGVMDHTMAATNLQIRKADDREGYLEADLRSAAFRLLLKAAKKFDPKRGVPFRGYYWKIARNAVIDVKKKLPSGLTGNPEPKEHRAEPCRYEREAGAIADRILRARSEAYVRRWCRRPDVDAIDLDIMRLHLIRPDDRSVPFHGLEDIAVRHSVSKQAIAKRRKLIVTDLLGKTSKRGSDKQTPQEPVGKWLSASEDERSCFEGAGQQTAPLIETYQQALEKFAAGTSFNLYWREMPKIFGQVDTSLQWLASISGTPESVYAMLSNRGRRALREMGRIRSMLGLKIAPFSFLSQTRGEGLYGPDLRAAWLRGRKQYYWELLLRRQAAWKPALAGMKAWRTPKLEPIFAPTLARPGFETQNHWPVSEMINGLLIYRDGKAPPLPIPNIVRAPPLQPSDFVDHGSTCVRNVTNA
jgi:hypothetical protein